MSRDRDGGGALRLVVAVCFEACLAILGLLLLGLRSSERSKRAAQTLFDAVCFKRRMPMSDRKKWTHARMLASTAPLCSAFLAAVWQCGVLLIGVVKDARHKKINYTD